MFAVSIGTILTDASGEGVDTIVGALVVHTNEDLDQATAYAERAAEALCLSVEEGQCDGANTWWHDTTRPEEVVTAVWLQEV